MNKCDTKYPIVLVHGIGYSDEEYPDYWDESYYGDGEVFWDDQYPEECDYRPGPYAGVADYWSGPYVEEDAYVTGPYYGN